MFSFYEAKENIMKKLSVMFLLSATILTFSSAGYARGGHHGGGRHGGGHPHPALTAEQKQCVHDCRTACDQKPTREEKHKCKRECHKQCVPGAAAPHASAPDAVAIP